MTTFDWPSYVLGWGSACAVWLFVLVCYHWEPTRRIERENRRRDDKRPL